MNHPAAILAVLPALAACLLAACRAPVETPRETPREQSLVERIEAVEDEQADAGQDEEAITENQAQPDRAELPQPTDHIQFRVRFGDDLSPEAVSGRLVVYMIADTAELTPGTPPASGPFFYDPQPMYGVDVEDLAAGEWAIVGERKGASHETASYPVTLAQLPPGDYTVQAVLDRFQRDSSWRREPGNLYSEAMDVRIHGGEQEIDIDLTNVVKERTLWQPGGVPEFVEVRSELLSDFHGRDVFLRAGVARPLYEDPERKYAAVYEIPGFGGDHTGVYQVTAQRERMSQDDGVYPEKSLAEGTFHIVLDPGSGNGHHLFADSANNGPVGRALVEELIPALEEKYNLIRDPFARILRGHSSGGWSAIWLAITYPDVFGAAWSSAPDPVDFRRFQRVNVYEQDNLYFRRIDGRNLEIPSFRQDGMSLMSNRDENLMEEVMGPRNTSAQQWDSWFAVFCPKGADGNPAALFDPDTGEIDRSVAEAMRGHDIAERVRQDPGSVALAFRQRIRLIVGEQDNYYLNEAVALLRDEVMKINFFTFPEGEHGYIKTIPGDHTTVLEQPEAEAFPDEMLGHLRRHGHAQ